MATEPTYMAALCRAGLEDYQDDIKAGKLLVFHDPFDLDDLGAAVEEVLAYSYRERLASSEPAAG